MTLLSFKRGLKIAGVFALLAVYGFGFYSVGKHSSEKTKSEVKGVSEIQKKDDEIEKPLPYIDVQSGSIIGEYAKLCSNTQYGFELAYPKDWFTTYDDESQQCRFFAPFSFVIPYSLDQNFVPVKVEVVESDAWEDTVDYYENPNEFQNVLSSQNLEISGKSVKKIEAISTGLNTLSGLVRVTYLIFDNKVPIVIAYNQLDASEDVDLYKDNLDQMVGSLKYF